MNTRFLYLRLLLVLLASWGLFYNSHAQVTIGDKTAPHSFSVLELSSQTTKGGLRLPHLTTSERDDLNNSSKAQTIIGEDHRGDATAMPAVKPGLALGLTIYNTDTNCIEYWDGYKWVSLCQGSADILLKENCGGTGGYYDAAAPPTATADGQASGCVYTPEETPSCTVPTGKPYQTYLTAGTAYASLYVDNLTSDFSLQFSPNNGSTPRTAIVRVVNNCTGEYKDFIFLQAGAPCPGTATVTLSDTALTLCDGGSVYARVQSPAAGLDYIWAYGGVVVHTGTWYEIRRAGTYTVYPGLLGCGTPAVLHVTASGSVAPGSFSISATNGGVLCAGGNVILTASTSMPVQWYHDGVPVGTPTIVQQTVSGATSAGDWFAVEISGSCISPSSNIINLIDNTSAGAALPEPQITLDGASAAGGGPFTLCESGSALLNISNAGVYAAGTSFEWFINGISFGRTTNPRLSYTIPLGSTSLVISLQVSNSGLNCPNTMVMQPIFILLTAPAQTTINNGDAKADICSGQPAVLTAVNQSGTAYAWYKDGVLISGANTFTYNATDPGEYTMRYQSGTACWSRFSPSITVERSNAVGLQWFFAPASAAVYGEIQTYSVSYAPAPDSFTWTAVGSLSGPIAMTPMGDGSMAQIEYPTLTAPAREDVTISVSATNKCGTTYLQPAVVEVAPGCLPVTPVSINPPGKTSMLIGGQTTFTASNTNATIFSWSINGGPILQSGPSRNFVFNAVSMGSYTLQVEASTGCVGVNSSSTATAVVEIRPDLSAIDPYVGTVYRFTGLPTCYDVKQTSSTDCGQLDGRYDTFSDGYDPVADVYSFKYTLEHNAGQYFNNLMFFVDDPLNTLDPTTPYTVSGDIITLHFRKNIHAFVKTRGKSEITLTAVFNENITKQRKLVRVLPVQDCSCCGAWISATVWKVFKCHNEGADTTKNPFVMSKDIAGNYYQWGRPTPAATADTPAGAITGWNGVDAPNGSWNDSGAVTVNDPCYSIMGGWRMPSLANWQAVLTEVTKNPRTDVGTWSNVATNFSAGLFFGDGIVLPAAGYRTGHTSQGQLTGRGNELFYWTSTINGQYAYYFNGGLLPFHYRTYGASVRCVAD